MAAKQSDLLHRLIGAAILQFRRAVGRQQNQRRARHIGLDHRRQPVGDGRARGRDQRHGLAFRLGQPQREESRRPFVDNHLNLQIGMAQRRQREGRRARSGRNHHPSAVRRASQAVEQGASPAKTQRRRFAHFSSARDLCGGRSCAQQIEQGRHFQLGFGPFGVGVGRRHDPGAGPQMRFAALDMGRAQHHGGLAVAVEIDPAGEAGVKAVAALLDSVQPVRAPRSWESRARRASDAGGRWPPADRSSAAKVPVTGVHKCCSPRSFISEGVGAWWTSSQISRKSPAIGLTTSACSRRSLGEANRRAEARRLRQAGETAPTCPRAHG